MLGSESPIRTGGRGAALVLDSVEALAFVPGNNCLNDVGFSPGFVEAVT